MLQDRINFHKKTFTKTDWKIHEWIVKNKSKKISNNIGKVSESIGVSNSAITRFCQKIKLDGWNELLFVVKHEKTILDKKRSEHSNINDIIYSLSRTEDDINQNAIKLIAKKIKDSEHIYLYGESFTELIGIQFARKLNKIGLSASVLNVASDLAIIMPKKKSIHIMISMSGMNPNIKLAVKKIRRHETERQDIYAIGSNKYSNISEYVNEYIGGSFYQTTSSDPYELPNIASYVVTYILNKIFDAVYETDEQKFDDVIKDIAKKKIR